MNSIIQGLVLVGLIGFNAIGRAEAAKDWYGLGNRFYEKRVEVKIKNSSALARKEEPVVLKIADIKKSARDFPGCSCVVVDPGITRSPCGIEKCGNNLPHQIDDLDNDGQPDELVFLVDAVPSSEKTIFIYYTASKDVPAIVYPKRTQITDFKNADPSITCLALESETAMYRYNTGALLDVFGKHTEYRGYSQHLFSHYKYFYDHRHACENAILDILQDSPAGRSILNPNLGAKALGLGGIILRKGGEVSYCLQNSEASVQIVKDGLIRSIGEIVMSPWEVFGDKYEVRIRLTMYAGAYYLQEEVEVKELPGLVPATNCTLGIGLMKLNDEIFSSDQLSNGCVLSCGNRIPLGVKDVWLAMLFNPDTNSAQIDQSEESGSHILLWQKPVTKMWLYGSWLKGGYFTNYDAFAAFVISDQLPKLLSPLGSEIRGCEENAAVKSKPEELKAREFFVSNSSSQKNTLPAEFDLDHYGFRVKDGVEAVDEKGKALTVDLVEMDGKQRLFMGLFLDQGETRKITVQPTDQKARPGVFAIEIKDSDNDGGDEVSVKTPQMEWLINPKGVSHYSANQKKQKIIFPVLSFPGSYKIKLMHNGANVAIVRFSSTDGEKFCDFYFYVDKSVKVVTNEDFAMQTALDESSRLYVGKKELRQWGCGSGAVSWWSAVASEDVFFGKETEIYYPAEWGCLYNASEQTGIMVYGSPSIAIMKLFKAPMHGIKISKGEGKRQWFYLSIIDKPESGEKRFAELCPPIVSIRKSPDSFISISDCNGNDTWDSILIEDNNSNKIPDFEGDKWSFDLDGDDSLQSVIEFEHRKDAARIMKVNADTVSGCYAMHGNQLYDYHGNKPRPSPEERYCYTINPYGRNKYDGCLSEQELVAPTFIYEDWNNDGLFFKGPRFEGGFIDCGKITSSHCFAGGSGRDWCPGVKNDLYNDYQVEIYDLDGDGDSDCALSKCANKRVFGWPFIDGIHTNVIGVGFDLSDANLEEHTIIEAWSGQTRYVGKGAWILANNKGYGNGIYDDEGRIRTGNDWPCGWWDIDNDGLPEANAYLLYDGFSAITFDLRHANKEDKPVVKNKLYLQHRRFAMDDTYNITFWIAADMRAAPCYPFATLKDPYGHQFVFGGYFVPDNWNGGKLECKSWPDGEYDYTPSNGWNSALRKYSFIGIYYFLKGHSFCGEEGVWGWGRFAPVTRIEVDSDGTSSYYEYYSPFISGLHYRGLEYGVQFMHPRVSAAIRQRFEDHYPVEKSIMADCGPTWPCYLNDYPREWRLYGDMFLYYVDHDKDGYVDTYILDDNADGYYEKRLWYDRAKKTVEFMDGDNLARWVEEVSFPGAETKLKNYNQLVEWNRKGEEDESYLWKYRLDEKGLAFLKNNKSEFAMLPAEDIFNVGMDIFHREIDKKDPWANYKGDKKDPWADFNSTGLDTLGRVFSEEKTKLRIIDQKLTKELLDGIDLLIMYNISIAPDDETIKIIEDYIQSGGKLLFLVNVDSKEPIKNAVENNLREILDGNKAVEYALCERLGGIKIINSKAILTKKPMSGSLYSTEDKGDIYGQRREIEMADKAKVINLLEVDKQPVIMSIKTGKGEVIIVPSDILVNRWMSLERGARKDVPAKPVNQALALKLVNYLVKGKK